MAEHDKHEAHRRLLERLRQQAEDVERITRGLEDERLAKRTVHGKWSLKELVCHLWRVQQIFEGRIASMLREDNPAVVSYDPDEDDEFPKMTTRPARELIDGFLAGRARFVEWLDPLSPADWHRPGRHPDYPAYDVHFQVEYMAYHEAHHIYQMFQRRAPFGKLPH
jgi:hypothetical protein